MVRLLGIELNDKKAIYISLTSIYGIGESSARRICEKLSINPEKKTYDLTSNELAAIRQEIDKNYIVEGNLKQKIARNIEGQKDINCYKGIRHKKRLPVRGQRTKTNARTVKGPRKTVANKKEAKQQG